MNRAMEVAAKVLFRAQRKGRPLASAMRDVLPKAGLSPAERTEAWRLVHGAVRWRRWLDHCLSTCSPAWSPEATPELAPLVRVAAFKVAVLGEDARLVSSEAWGIAAKLRLDATITRNTVLAVDATKAIEALPSNQDEASAVRLSYPDWIFQELADAFGWDAAGDVAGYLNAEPRTILFASPLAGGIDAALAALKAEGVRFEPTGCCPNALAGDERLPGESKALASGMVLVQDEGSQLVAHLAAPSAGQRMLDYCAGSGGKSLAVAAITGGKADVLAWDRDVGKLEALARRAAKMGAKVAVAEPGQLAGAEFDAVLVDAPCSGLGAIRRNPEAKWSADPGELERLGQAQLDILSQASMLVASGGKLVYSVCTFTRRETADVVAAFLAGHPEFENADPSLHMPAGCRARARNDGSVLTYPAPKGADIFYVMVMQKKR